MKKILIVTLFAIFFGGNVFSQQLIWTTTSNDNSVRVIHKQNVKNEILKFCDQHAYYENMTGYSKNEFIKRYGSDGSWDWANDINEYTVMAMRVPIEIYLFTYILIIKKSSIDMILFSDIYDNDFNSTTTGRNRLSNLLDSILE